MKSPEKVLFVCSWNCCRSPMAEALLKHLSGNKIKTFSAGTETQNGNIPTSGAVEVLKEEGIDISGHRTTALDSAIIDSATLILVMEEFHLERIRGKFPEAVAKTFLLKAYGLGKEKDEAAFYQMGIIDPGSAPLPVFRELKDEIENLIKRTLKRWQTEK